jgi:hypothetical protein
MNQDEFNEAERRSKLRMQVIYEGAKKPKRGWVGLTEQDMAESARWADEHGGGPFYIAYAQALEQILKERNT